jgi:cytochrome c peroxidase
VGHVIERIKSLNDYQGLFESAFAMPPNMQNVGDAFAAYQASLVSAESNFDRWYYAKQKDALNDNEKAGFKLFMGKAACSTCHSITKNKALFTDQKLHNTGIGYNESMGITPKTQRIALAPGVFVDVDTSVFESVTAKPPSDLGRYEITQNPQDRWHYKTPSLRNISRTAPYMHNGSLSTLREVIQFYNRGGIKNKELDPAIKPLSLSDVDVDHLLAFLKSLDGNNIEALVSDAFTAPIGDTKH